MIAIVVLGDVRTSRRAHDRDALGRRVQAAFATVNARHAGDLVAEFEVQRGAAEFAGLLQPGPQVGRVIASLWEELHPASARFSIVKGMVDVVPASGSVREHDGPAFHEAARLMGEERRKGRVVQLALGDARRDAVLRSLANVLYAHLLGWTPRQLEVFRTFREAGAQQATAERLGITQPTVSNALTAIHAALMLDAYDHFVREAGELASAPVPAEAQ